MFHLKQMVNQRKSAFWENIEVGNATKSLRPSLHIATTSCSDGLLHLFDFPPKSYSARDAEHFLRCLEASCKIPTHFHPFDVLPNRWFPPSTYPEEDGVIIDGKSYADGEISAPAPPTPSDSKEGAGRIIISPIAGSNNGDDTIRISPA